jgi:4-hydroxy-tetrahydrodipicolinate reductase
MRIGVVGASGRVGTRLVESILANPGLELAAALVSPSSNLIGRPVANGSLVYRPAAAAMKSNCDVMIDFSTPGASMALQNAMGAKRIPMVIGTTGYTAEQEARLTALSRFRPLLISANFALGFEAFTQVAFGFARQLPGVEPTVVEAHEYSRHGAGSGPSDLLAKGLQAERSSVMGFAAGATAVVTRRKSNTAGFNEVRFNLGSCEVSLTFVVHTLAAYAEGAISAAQWLVSEAPAIGRFSCADCFKIR